MFNPAVCRRAKKTDKVRAGQQGLRYLGVWFRAPHQAESQRASCADWTNNVLCLIRCLRTSRVDEDFGIAEPFHYMIWRATLFCGRNRRLYSETK